MPVEAVIAIAAVTLAFASFAVTLAWGLNRAGGPAAR